MRQIHHRNHNLKQSPIETHRYEYLAAPHLLSPVEPLSTAPPLLPFRSSHSAHISRFSSFLRSINDHTMKVTCGLRQHKFMLHCDMKLLTFLDGLNFFLQCDQLLIRHLHQIPEKNKDDSMRTHRLHPNKLLCGNHHTFVAHSQCPMLRQTLIALCH